MQTVTGINSKGVIWNRMGKPEGTFGWQAVFNTAPGGVWGQADKPSDYNGFLRKPD